MGEERPRILVVRSNHVDENLVTQGIGLRHVARYDVDIRRRACRRAVGEIFQRRFLALRWIPALRLIDHRVDM